MFKKLKFVLLFFIAVLFSNISLSQTAIDDFDFSSTKKNIENPNIKLDLKDKVLSDADDKIPNSINDIERKLDEEEEPKNPVVGALLSAVLPGLGEFYGKNYIKAGAFLAVEAALWVTYTIFQNKGDDQTSYYQDYANQNWDVRKYARWLKREPFSGNEVINPDEQNLNILRNQLNLCEEKNFSHTLPNYGEQQYYEVIGKYQNFVVGWSEANYDAITKANYGTTKLGQVDFYMSERENANTWYSRGSLMITVVILNHILSAADAVWSVITYNKKLQLKTNMSVKYHYDFAGSNDYKLVPYANLTLNF